MNQSFSLYFLRFGLSALVIAAVPASAGDRSLNQPPATSGIVFSDGQSADMRIPPDTNSSIRDVSVGPGFSFNPSAVKILPGDTVRWTFVANTHDVTSGSPCAVDNKYCSPSDNACSSAPTSAIHTVYSHTFAEAGVFPYFCRVHCSFGMTGTVEVVTPLVTSVTLAAGGHFLVNGTSVPSSSATLKSAPDLITGFSNPQVIATDANGVFKFDDTSAAGATAQFYQVSFP